MMDETVTRAATRSSGTRVRSIPRPCMLRFLTYDKSASDCVWNIGADNLFSRIPKYTEPNYPNYLLACGGPHLYSLPRVRRRVWFFVLAGDPSSSAVSIGCLLW